MRRALIAANFVLLWLVFWLAWDEWDNVANRQGWAILLPMVVVLSVNIAYIQAMPQPAGSWFERFFRAFKSGWNA